MGHDRHAAQQIPARRARAALSRGDNARPRARCLHRDSAACRTRGARTEIHAVRSAAGRAARGYVGVSGIIGSRTVSTIACASAQAS